MQTYANDVCELAAIEQKPSCTNALATTHTVQATEVLQTRKAPSAEMTHAHAHKHREIHNRGRRPRWTNTILQADSAVQCYASTRATFGFIVVYSALDVATSDAV
jgi:hypothetical protein